MAERKIHCKPRRSVGGRSDRYDSRHIARGYETHNAPDWTDMAARIVFDGLDASREVAGQTLAEFVGQVLDGVGEPARFLAADCAELGKADREKKKKPVEKCRPCSGTRWR